MDAEAGRAGPGAAGVRGAPEGAAPTAAAFEAAFEAERARRYPEVDRFCGGLELDPDRLEGAARVLACPVKARPPCWQHGRVVYAAVRALADGHSLELLDVGTAKGFSALCAAWAAADAGVPARVTSVDVVDPAARVPRNSPRDLDDPPPTVPELLAEWWPRRVARQLVCGRSTDFLRARPGYAPDFAFLDGKHSLEVVSEELSLLAARCRRGAVVVADDVQVPGVARAVSAAVARGDFDGGVVEAIPGVRSYAVLRKS